MSAAAARAEAPPVRPVVVAARAAVVDDPVAPRLGAIARAAVASLHAELVLAPKPGLVCPDDAGSHADMDATTMMRSLFALRHGFARIVRIAAAGGAFAALESAGIEAERRMLAATRGVNTHRGAIFTIGLLAAAAAWRVACGACVDARALRCTLRARWGHALANRPALASSHGGAMALAHGARGARDEAAAAFPALFDVVLPALVAARRAGNDEHAARLHALMTAIAHVDDTNLLYRGGATGLAHARAAARAFLAAGGVARPDRDAALRDIGRGFVARRLSPGGAADLLAAALFVDRVCGGLAGVASSRGVSR